MVIQELRRANTIGSPTAPPAASLVRTRANDEAAAAQPASATTHTLDRFGAREARKPASDASADAAMPLTPLSRECPQHVDGTSQAQPLMRVAQRTRMKGGVCARGYSPTCSGASNSQPLRPLSAETSQNDTRDVSRRISSACNSPICRRKYVAGDRACARVTPRNLHGRGSTVRVPQRASLSACKSAILTGTFACARFAFLLLLSALAVSQSTIEELQNAGCVGAAGNPRGRGVDPGRVEQRPGSVQGLCRSGKRRRLRGRWRLLVVEAGEPLQPAGEVPVPGAEQLHGRGQ